MASKPAMRHKVSIGNNEVPDQVIDLVIPQGPGIYLYGSDSEVANYLDGPGATLEVEFAQLAYPLGEGGDREHKHFLRSFAVSIAWDLMFER